VDGGPNPDDRSLAPPTGVTSVAPVTPASPGAATLVPAALASVGAGVIHAAAVGIHTEHVGLTRLFVLLAAAQVGAAVWALLRPTARLAAVALVGVNAAAFGGWLFTRFAGVSWIAGLEQAEPAQPADVVAALLALVAVGGGAAFLLHRSAPLARVPVAAIALLVGVLTVPAMVSATSHRHDHGGGAAHGDSTTHAADHAHDGATQPIAAGDDHHGAQPHDTVHSGDDHHAAGDAHAADDHHAAGDAHAADDHHTPGEPVAAAWPRPWDPALPFDFSGVPGVTPEQQARAEQLVADTQAILPRFADVTTVGALGYRSIGDAGTGFEHYINRALIGDDVWLDPAAPESLVYRVEGDARILVSAMFMVGGRSMDDPELRDYAGPLMEWHVHDNLCWGRNENGDAVVKAVTDNHGGVCPPGTVLAGGDNPMVHVWITPHPCGPFAALEGHGAGQAFADDASRSDQCHHEHGQAGHGTTAAPP
jgi:hypothetical protein